MKTRNQKCACIFLLVSVDSIHTNSSVVCLYFLYHNARLSAFGYY